RFDPDYTPPPPPQLSSLRVKLYPNPAWVTGIGADLHLSGDATAYEGEIYDLRGRLVHRFRAAGNGQLIWNGRDLDQRWVDPGVYFVRVRGGGAEATSRVVMLR
ncbi:MAG: T9SS type A sorting domain-containing protein, partial [Candidatus Eisenbacteria bacterium]